MAADPNLLERLDELYYEQASDILQLGDAYSIDRAIRRGRSLRFQRRATWVFAAAAAVALSSTSVCLYFAQYVERAFVLASELSTGALIAFFILGVAQGVSAWLAGSFAGNADYFISLARRHRKIVALEKLLQKAGVPLSELHARRELKHDSAVDRFFAIDVKDASDNFAGDMRIRIRDEIQSRKLAARVYFYIGALTIATTGVLVVAVVYTIFRNISLLDSDKLPFLLAASPLSITFLSAASFFFFVMSRHYDTEGKYFHNELSTVEMRLLPWAELQWLFDPQMRESVPKETAAKAWEAYYRILALYSMTERNFILKKGESTSLNRQIEAEGKIIADWKPLGGGKGDPPRST